MARIRPRGGGRIVERDHAFTVLGLRGTGELDTICMRGAIRIRRGGIRLVAPRRGGSSRCSRLASLVDPTGL